MCACEHLPFLSLEFATIVSAREIAESSTVSAVNIFAEDLAEIVGPNAILLSMVEGAVDEQKYQTLVFGKMNN